jgi:hypothetical protein
MKAFFISIILLTSLHSYAQIEPQKVTQIALETVQTLVGKHLKTSSWEDYVRSSRIVTRREALYEMIGLDVLPAAKRAIPNIKDFGFYFVLTKITHEDVSSIITVLTEEGEVVTVLYVGYEWVDAASEFDSKY